MINGPQRPTFPFWTALALAGMALATWAAWLGWDQHRDVHPDGSTTGPYEAWQVIGLGLTLLAPVCWAAYRSSAMAAVSGTTAGLTAAAFYDWSDAASGLYAVGAVMVMLGSLLATGAVSLVMVALRRRTAGPGPGAAGR